MKTLNFRRLLIVMLLGALSLPLFAQKDFYPGFIVKEGKGLQRGQIGFYEDGLNPRRISFRGAEDTAVYTANDLKGFMIVKDGDTLFYKKAAVTYAGYTSASLQEIVYKDSSLIIKDTVFLELMVQGALSLYVLHQTQDNNVYYLQKKDSAMRELVYRRYAFKQTGVVAIALKDFVFTLFNYVSDCTDAVNLLKKIDYTGEELQRVVVTYNRCFTANENVYIRSKEKTKFKLSAFAGISATTADMKGFQFPFNDKRFATGVGYFAGAAFNINLSNTIPRLWFDIEVAVKGFKLSGNNSYYYSAFNNYKLKTELNLMYVRFYVLPMYYFGKKGAHVNPYVNIGPSVSFVAKQFSNKREVTQSVGTSAPSPYQKQIIDPLKKYEIGLCASFGVEIYRYFGLDARYEMGNHFTFQRAKTSFTHSVMVTARFIWPEDD